MFVGCIVDQVKSEQGFILTFSEAVRRQKISYSNPAIVSKIELTNGDKFYLSLVLDYFKTDSNINIGCRKIENNKLIGWSKCSFDDSVFVNIDYDYSKFFENKGSVGIP